MIKTTTGMLLFLLHIAIAQGSVITFEPSPCRVCDSTMNSYLEDGALFTGAFSHYDMGLPGAANNASSGALRFPFFSSLRVQLADGTPFSLGTVDLGEYNNSSQGNPVTVSFAGLRTDSTVVSQSFTLDGLMDGAGGINDFQTFAFAPEFDNLLHVDISSTMFAIDNLEINAVPVPAAALLFISGLVVLIGITPRKT